jgi:hypothetical protein
VHDSERMRTAVRIDTDHVTGDSSELRRRSWPGSTNTTRRDRGLTSRSPSERT